MSAEAYQIAQSSVRLIRLPLERAWGDAIQKFTALELIVATIRSQDGTSGTGFGYTIGTGGASICLLVRDALLPVLEGKDSRRIVGIHEELKSLIHALTPGCISSSALAAVDIALWDLAARRSATPLHILLGGAKEKILAYNTHVGWLNRPLDEMLELSREAVQRDGFRALKIKVGKQEAEEDEQRLARLREELGNNVTLFLDANQSWSRDEAVRRLKRLERFSPSWIEEPLPAGDSAGYRALALHSDIPRAGGESIYSPAEFFAHIRDDELDIVQPDISRIGGITPALRVAAVAEAANIRISPHVSPELSVSIAAALPNSLCVEYIPQMEPLLEFPLRLDKGYALPFEGPGHGIPFSERAMQDFEVEV
jgi:L-alanine-DL-glutamate epimerase-like enolase superfamily enzyme